MLKHWILAAAIVSGGTLLAQHHIHRQVAQSLNQSAPPAHVAVRAKSPHPKATSLHISAVDFISPKVGWVVGAPMNANGQLSTETVYRTVDGGKTWSPIATWDSRHPLPAPEQSTPGIPPITRLSFQNRHLGHAVEFLGVGTGQAAFGVLYTNDGGRHWKLETRQILVGSNGPISLSFPGNGATGWLGNGSFAGAYTLLAKTTDNGRSWSTWAQVPGPVPSPSALDMHFSSLTSGYMVVASNGYQKTRPSLQIMTTRDGGLRWKTQKLSVNGLPDLITGLSYVNPTTGWVVAGSINSPYEVYHWNHGTWAPRVTPGQGTSNPPLLDLVSANAAYLSQFNGSSSSLWKTVDGGTHWTRVTLPR